MPPAVPDPRVSGSYARILHHVEANAPAWVDFDFTVRSIAQRVAQRLRKHPLGYRYDVIWAHDHVFIRTKYGEIKRMIEGKQ